MFLCWFYGGEARSIYQTDMFIYQGHKMEESQRFGGRGCCKSLTTLICKLYVVEP